MVELYPPTAWEEKWLKQPCSRSASQQLGTTHCTGCTNGVHTLWVTLVWAMGQALLLHCLCRWSPLLHCMCADAHPLLHHVSGHPHYNVCIGGCWPLSVRGCAAPSLRAWASSETWRERGGAWSPVCCYSMNYRESSGWVGAQGLQLTSFGHVAWRPASWRVLL